MLLQHEGMRLTLQIVYIMLITSMLLNFCNFVIFEHEIDFRDFHRKKMAVKYSAWEYGKTAQDSTFLSCTYKKPFVMPRAENNN